MELSGRIQDLQNEVNCMNDSKDFQDAESVRSGNSHVTSRPVSFPPLPIPGGMLRQSFVSPAAEKGRQALGTHMVYRETFLQIHLHLQQLLILKNCINGTRPKSRSIHPQWRKVKTKSRTEMPVRTVSQRFSHLQWRRPFNESWGRPTNTADFGSSL